MPKQAPIRARMRAPEVAGRALERGPPKRHVAEAVPVQRAQHAPDQHRLAAHPHPGCVPLRRARGGGFGSALLRGGLRGGAWVSENYASAPCKTCCRADPQLNMPMYGVQAKVVVIMPGLAYA